VVTSAADTADERNSVEESERAAFVTVLERAGLPHRHTDRLEDALQLVKDTAGERDLVLLLGAQGMDAAADLLRRIQ
jgi:UDP-N-acetylmuramoyl-L-alanyl-D-glutamate--2,6-diaminopimelate ligase